MKEVLFPQKISQTMLRYADNHPVAKKIVDLLWVTATEQDLKEFAVFHEGHGDTYPELLRQAYQGRNWRISKLKTSVNWRWLQFYCSDFYHWYKKQKLGRGKNTLLLKRETLLPLVAKREEYKIRQELGRSPNTGWKLAVLEELLKKGYVELNEFCVAHEIAVSSGEEIHVTNPEHFETVRRVFGLLADYISGIRPIIYKF